MEKTILSHRKNGFFSKKALGIPKGDACVMEWSKNGSNSEPPISAVHYLRTEKEEKHKKLLTRRDISPICVYI